jgi:hypothetical protein
VSQGRRGEDFLKKSCELLEKLEEEEFELLATVARRNWLCINSVVYGGDSSHPASCLKCKGITRGILRS